LPDLRKAPKRASWASSRFEPHFSNLGTEAGRLENADSLDQSPTAELAIHFCILGENTKSVRNRNNDAQPWALPDPVLNPIGSLAVSPRLLP
jgi:hypothetical protein